MKRCVLIGLCGWLVACGGNGAGSAPRPAEAAKEPVGAPLLWKIARAGKTSHVFAVPPPGVHIDIRHHP